MNQPIVVGIYSDLEEALRQSGWGKGVIGSE